MVSLSGLPQSSSAVSPGNEETWASARNSPGSGRSTPRIRKKTRRLTNARDEYRRIQNTASVGEWAQASRLMAEEVAAGRAGGRAGHMDGDEFRQTSASPAASSGPRLGIGGGVGAPVPPNGFETPVKKEGEGVEKTEEENLEQVMQEGIRDQKLSAGQRRVEEVETDIQKIFIPIINSDAFYYVIMGAIFVNCIQLAATSPLEPSPDPKAMQDANTVIDWILFAVFTCEFILKHLALYPRAYWSDSWNQLDGTIVVVGYLAFVPGVGEYPAIRVLRVIRPLRVLGKLEGMKKIMVTIGSAMAGLIDTLMLCCLIFFMFGIVGCTLFAGVTRHRCYIPTESVDNSTNATTYGAPWSLADEQERRCGGWYTCPSPQKCFFSHAAPSYSIVSFDNILIGFLTLFVAITLEGWVDVMYLIQDGYSYFAATVFFHLLIVFGSLFTLNLALAVISDAYENQEADWEAAEREASNALRKVELIDEAIELEKYGITCRQMNDERETLIKAVDFVEESNTAEIDEIESEIIQCKNKVQECIDNITKLSETLAAEESCKKEADAVALIAKLMEETIADEDDVEEDTPEQIEEALVTEREGMNACQAQFHMVATAGWFDKMIMAFIILNTLCLAMEHTREQVVDGVLQAVEMDQGIQDALKYFNYVFIVVFTLEVVIKMGGLGIMKYFSNNFNKFDFFIVIMSFVELGFAGNSSLSALRTFRLARVMKLAKNWKSLRDLINTIVQTLPAMSYLSILLLLFMFIMSVAGMMFFGGKFDKDTIDGRHLFDNFGVAMLTVFQMLTGENHNSVLYDGINSTSYFCVPYFLIVQILGGFVVLNLFLAILLSGFADEEEEEDDVHTQNMSERWKGTMSMFFMSSKVEPEPAAAAAGDAPETVAEVTNPAADAADVSDVSGPDSSNTVNSSGQGSGAGVLITEGQVEEETEKKAVAMESIAKLRQDIINTEKEAASKPVVVLGIEDMDVLGRSVYCFPHDSAFRRRLALIVGWSPSGEEAITTPFANFIFLMIIISTITLAIDEPHLAKDSAVKETLNVFDLIFTIIFAVEMVMKMIVYGFIFTPNAYMSDGWNILDFFIVMTSIIALPANGLFGDNSSFSSLSVLRTFRSLRPLRMINRAPGLKVVVDAIFKCLPAFINIGLVSWLVYLVFAIMGVQLWAGKFWYCTDDSVASVKQCIGNFTDGDGAVAMREWKNKPLNFDNVLNAQLTLFEVASLEIWLDVMYAAMDVPEKLGEQPQRDQSWAWALYFVVFIVVGSFLMMNLFVGAVVDNFNRIKCSMDKKGAVMTDEQEAFVQSMKTMFNKKPGAKCIPPDKAGGAFEFFRYQVWKFITYDYFQSVEVRRRRKMGEAITKKEGTPIFDHIIMALIAANILVMAAPMWKQPDALTEVDSLAAVASQNTDWNMALENINTVFNFLFLIECTLKLIGLGPRQYFSSKMNSFDFGIVMISLLGFIIDQALENVDPGLMSIISVIKAGRVVRIFRLAMRVKGIRRLLETLIYTLPSLFNVTCLLIIVLFIYTVLGMAFFGDQEFGKPPFELYEKHAHFQRFHIGFFTLFRMSTGESWNGIMHDSMENVSPYAWIYYFTYMIVGSNLLFQLIVAVVLEQFGSAKEEEESVVSPDTIEMFATTWREMDPQQTHLIAFGQVPIFLKLLGDPLGLPSDATTKQIMEFLKETELKSHNGQAHYVETFFTLVMYVFKKKYKNRWKGTLDQNILMDLTQQLTAGFPSIDNVHVGDEEATVKEYAALKIQSITRKRQAAKRSLKKKRGSGMEQAQPSSPGLMSIAEVARTSSAGEAAATTPVPPIKMSKEEGEGRNSPRPLKQENVVEKPAATGAQEVAAPATMAPAEAGSPEVAGSPAAEAGSPAAETVVAEAAPAGAATEPEAGS